MLPRQRRHVEAQGGTRAEPMLSTAEFSAPMTTLLEQKQDGWVVLADDGDGDPNITREEAAQFVDWLGERGLRCDDLNDKAFLDAFFDFRRMTR